MQVFNIFVCYTLRDGVLDRVQLKALSNVLGLFGEVFVDLIDNVSEDAEGEWMRRLKAADLMVVCRTPGVYESPWVLHELAFAARTGLPVIVLDLPIPSRLWAAS